MPHFTDFNRDPPFPSDIPIAKLKYISLADLRNGNELESEALFDACKQDGFFLLDLRGDEQGEMILSEAGKLFDIGKALFDLDYDHKMEFVMGGSRSVFGLVYYLG